MATAKRKLEPVSSAVYKEGRKMVRDMHDLAFIAMLDTVLEKVGIMRENTIANMEIDFFTPFHDEVSQTGVHDTKSYTARSPDGTNLKVSFDRKKSNVALKPDELRKLAAAKIVLPAPSGPRMGINSEYVKDEAIIKKLEELIELGHKNGIEMPDDFIEPIPPKVTMNEGTVLDVLALDFQKAVGLLPVIGKVNVSTINLSPKLTPTKAMREVLAAMVEQDKSKDAA